MFPGLLILLATGLIVAITVFLGVRRSRREVRHGLRIRIRP